jgi:uncharacterized protein involved in response to NO
MSGRVTTFEPSAAALKLLAAAPHRLLFFVGASNVLLAMTWWTCWLVAARWGFVELPQPPVPAGWMHAIIMQYQVLPSFIFGFLLTVFPRWMNLPPLSRRHYVPVGVGLLGGQILTLAGLGGSLRLLKAGAFLTLLGWAIGTLLLVRLVVRDQGRTWHAVSCAFALGFGLLGLTFYLLFLFRLEALPAFAAIKIGSMTVLLPLFFTVCHRMIPFFTDAVVSGYRMIRPMWVLPVVWLLVIAHVWLELRHGYAWLWVVDAPLVVIFAALAWLWRPRVAGTPALLKVLFIGFVWLPLALLLHAGQSAWFAATGEFVLGRAPGHALTIGFFGSLLVAMVTRVTQGHSGRPLVLGVVAGIAFVLVQITALVRISAELLPDGPAWQAVAGMCWLLAFLPWVVRSSWIYLTPRMDGKAG